MRKRRQRFSTRGEKTTAEQEIGDPYGGGKKGREEPEKVRVWPRRQIDRKLFDKNEKSDGEEFP